MIQLSIKSFRTEGTLFHDIPLYKSRYIPLTFNRISLTEARMHYNQTKKRKEAALNQTAVICYLLECLSNVLGFCSFKRST